MDGRDSKCCTAFDGGRAIAFGDVATVAVKAKEVLDRDDRATVLIFDDATSELVEIDFRGTPDDVRDRLRRPAAGREPAGGLATRDAAPDPVPARGPGRPKLGVVAREVTLLPRHWEWLNRQPGGASVALRKLVEEARRVNTGRDDVRRAREVAYRFMSALAGNLPAFEDATRALFAGDRGRFDAAVAGWPPDVRDHATRLAAAVFPAGTGDDGSGGTTRTPEH